MAAWLDSAKKTLQEEQPGSAGSLMARKLAIVNGLGEHSRAQVLALPSSVVIKPFKSMRLESLAMAEIYALLSHFPKIRHHDA